MNKLNGIYGKINDSLNSFVSYTNVPEDITRQVDSSVVVTKKNDNFTAPQKRPILFV